MWEAVHDRWVLIITEECCMAQAESIKQLSVWCVVLTVPLLFSRSTPPNSNSRIMNSWSFWKKSEGKEERLYSLDKHTEWSEKQMFCKICGGTTLKWKQSVVIFKGKNSAKLDNEPEQLSREMTRGGSTNLCNWVIRIEGVSTRTPWKYKP